MASCFTVSRFCLILLNVLLFLIGVLLVVVGILFVLAPGTISTLDLTDAELQEALFTLVNTTYLAIAAWVCVGLGVIIIIISLCGCMGAGTLSTCLLAIYVFTVCLITIVQIAVCVIIFVSNTWYTEAVQESFADHLAGVNSTAENKAWGALQLGVGCCGINGTSDYNLTIVGERKLYETCCTVVNRIDAVGNFLNGSRPVNYTNVNACLDLPGNPEMAKSDVVNDIGCVEKLYSNIMTYAIIAIAVVAIEILIIILGCIVCCRAEDEVRPI